MTETMIRNGATRKDRFLPAMAEGYFNVDESTFEALVCQAAEFSACIRYTGFDDRPAGSWAPMFAGDEAVIFAAICAFDPEENLKRYVHISDHQSLSGLIGLVYGLAVRINHWYAALSRINTQTARQGARRIRHIIEKKLADLPLGVEQLADKAGLNFSPVPFDPVWAGAADGDIPKEPPDQLLAAAFYHLHSAIIRIRSQAVSLMEDSLRSQSHGPGPGLFLAFVKLYGRIREIQNRFTLRHRDFYYDRVLGYRPRPPQSDSTYLNFTKAKQADPVLILENDGFPAPPGPEGQPRIYRARHDLLVSNAQVAALKTLLFERDPLSAPESELGMVTGIRTAELEVRPPSDIKPDSRGVPFFGFSGHEAANTGIPAQAGLALSSPILMLAEGVRQVRVEFILAGTGDRQFESQLFKDFLDRTAALAGTSREDIFFKVFPKAFSIRLTTEEGWMTVKAYTPATSLTVREVEENRLRISFELDSGTPAVVPWMPEIHGGNYRVRFPVMQFLIDPESYAFPFSIFEEYEIRGVEIGVEVSGIKNLLLHSHLGRLDPNSPFQPLGPMADKDSYLVAGCRETAVKQLTRFVLDLEWGGLPRDKGGFETHYRGYDLEMDNRSFTAALSVLKDGVWKPSADLSPKLPLFEEDEDTRLSPFIRLDSGKMDLSGGGNHRLVDGDFDYTVHSRSGFFKYRLDTPAQGFGHQNYPYLLTRVMTENVKRGKFKPALEIPHPPYTPTVTGVSAGYRAHASLSPGQRASGQADTGEALFHIHPFGIRKIFPLPSQPPCPFIPQDHRQGRGNLMIGLSGLIPGSRLTLFFVLTDDAGAASTRDVPLVTWHYLKENLWHPIAKKDVARDTTRGFLTSGVVSVDLPSDIRAGSTVMGDDLYWLRVSTDDSLAGPASLFTVQANGLLVSLEDPEAFEEPLPPGSIKEALTALPGITGVAQPLASFEGRAPEAPDMRNIRMSERLKHKNRAVNPWDYERLILEHFPGVDMVKCFPGISSESWNCWDRRKARGKSRRWACASCRRYGVAEQPGHLLVCVVPKLVRADRPQTRDPQPRGDAVLLSRIQSFLAARASCFAAVEVRNPVYEKIQIRCTVRFADGHGGWGYRQRLNRDICSYISPWQPGGYEAAFGWRIRRSDIIAHIQSLSYVDFVTRFSMLRISKAGENCFELFDSVTPGAVAPSQDEKQIRPKVPWSIAVNADSHFIQSTAAVKPQLPERTGLNELEVGNTFIITG